MELAWALGIGQTESAEMRPPSFAAFCTGRDFHTMSAEVPRIFPQRACTRFHYALFSFLFSTPDRALNY